MPRRSLDTEASCAATEGVHGGVPGNVDSHAPQNLPDTPSKGFEASIVCLNSLIHMGSWTLVWSDLIRFRRQLVLPKEGALGYNLHFTETDLSDEQRQLDFFKRYRDCGCTKALSRIHDKADEYLRLLIGRGSTNVVFFVMPLSAADFLRARVSIDRIHLAGAYQIAQNELTWAWRKLVYLRDMVRSDLIATRNGLARMQDMVMPLLRDLLAETGKDGTQANHRGELLELEEDYADCLSYGEGAAASLQNLCEDLQQEMAQTDPWSILYKRFLALCLRCERGEGALVSELVEGANMLGAQLKFTAPSFADRRLEIRSIGTAPADVLATQTTEIMGELRQFDGLPPPHSPRTHETPVQAISAAVGPSSVTLEDARQACRVLRSFGQQTGTTIDLPDLLGLPGPSE